MRNQHVKSFTNSEINIATREAHNFVNNNGVNVIHLSTSYSGETSSSYGKFVITIVYENAFLDDNGKL